MVAFALPIELRYLVKGPIIGFACRPFKLFADNLMNALAERIEIYRAPAVTANRTELALSFGFNCRLQVCIANAAVTDKLQIFFYCSHHAPERSSMGTAYNSIIGDGRCRVRMQFRRFFAKMTLGIWPPLSSWRVMSRRISIFHHGTAAHLQLT